MHLIKLLIFFCLAVLTSFGFTDPINSSEERSQLDQEKEEVHVRYNHFNEADRPRRLRKSWSNLVARPHGDGVRQNPDLDLYGFWQTKEYEPPYAHNGRVPRNEFGNVELFQPHMLPHGCVHLKGMPNLNRVCRKLQVDCAAAVIGFDAHGGFSHAVYDGWVVCSENKELVVDAYRQEEMEAHKRAIEKRKERILANWKKLIQGVLIRERLKAKYDNKHDDNKGHPKITNKMLEKLAASTSSKDVQMDEIFSEEVAFTGDKEIVGGKLNNEAKIQEEPKGILSLKQSTSISAKAAKITRPTRTAVKRQAKKKVDLKPESDIESDAADGDYKPELVRNKKSSAKKLLNVKRNAKSKPKSSSESEQDDEEPPLKRPAIVAEKQEQKFKLQEDGELKLSESEDDNL